MIGNSIINVHFNLFFFFFFFIFFSFIRISKFDCRKLLMKIVLQIKTPFVNRSNQHYTHTNLKYCNTFIPKHSAPFQIPKTSNYITFHPTICASKSYALNLGISNVNASKRKKIQHSILNRSEKDGTKGKENEKRSCQLFHLTVFCIHCVHIHGATNIKLYLSSFPNSPSSEV